MRVKALQALIAMGQEMKPGEVFDLPGSSTDLDVYIRNGWVRAVEEDEPLEPPETRIEPAPETRIETKPRKRRKPKPTEQGG